tara:strand:- start:496 stop:1059 length:564 start_codon:yes stop_codon:yes gene_type:complete
MRIISGKLKGKYLNFLKSKTTRPLKDSVKENIFNVVSHSNLFDVNIENSKVLDLYSGIGSFGLECLSRGANNVTFVEKDKKAIAVLNQNLLNLSVKNKAIVNESEVSNFLKQKQSHKFDIFFLDPPFVDAVYIDNLKLIRKNKIFNKNHIVIVHRERSERDETKNLIESLIVRNYGRSKLIFGKFLR